MKALTTFETLATLTSSGENASYTDDNVKDLDPMVRWWSAAYAADQWLKIDFGAAKTLTAAFFNQANFPHCHIQGHATDLGAGDWTGACSFDLACDLVVDDTGNRKGWFDLTAFNYRWLKIFIPAAQTLDSSDTVIKLGNLIVGASVELPIAENLSMPMVQKTNDFEADGGSYFESNRGRKRHSISIDFNDTVTNVRALLKTWTQAVLYADLANAGESWLVFPPRVWDKNYKNLIEGTLRATFSERA